MKKSPVKQGVLIMCGCVLILFIGIPLYYVRAHYFKKWKKEREIASAEFEKSAKEYKKHARETELRIKAEKAKYIASWEKPKKGMTKREIAIILGEPDFVEPGQVFVTWKYRSHNYLAYRTSGGTIRFLDEKVHDIIKPTVSDGFYKR